MSAPRRFDWDEARRLRRTGMSYAEIARRVGVSPHAVKRACDAHYRNADALRQSLYQRGTCSECGEPCSWNRYRQEKPICRDCSHVKKATSVRPDSLYCASCREWKHDNEFAFSRSASKPRRGRHRQCRACQTEARQAYRERHRVPCACCGAPALPPNEKGPRGAPYPRCRACFHTGRVPETVPA